MMIAQCSNALRSLWTKKVLMGFSVTLILMFMRCIILVARFSTSNVVGQQCVKESNRSLNQSDAYDSWVVVVHYGVLEAMRFYEYLAITWHIYKYWIRKDSKFSTIIMTKKSLTECATIILSLCPAVLAIMTVVCQIMMEATVEDHESQRHLCSKYINTSKMYFAYCALNILRYVIALSIRCTMVITTIKICEIWDSSKGRLKSEINGRVQGDTQNGAKHGANKVHKLLSDEYDKSGEEIEKLSHPFRPWFIIPWVAYVFETSISAKHVLMPWEEGSKDSFSIWVKIYTMLYSVTQFWMLLIQYLCALKINGSHQQYCRETRKLQMTAFDKDGIDDAFIISYKAHARKLNIEFQANYNFSPTIWGFHMNIPMDSPIYVLLLLLNTFVTLSQSFFSTNSPNIYVL